MTAGTHGAVPPGTGPADLKARRLALGMTQAALARALGVDQGTISRWEAGRIAVASPAMLHLALERIEERAAQGPG